MRVIVCTWAWQSHLTPLVQLCWGLRTSGHEVVVASSAGLVPAIRATGLTAVAVGEDVDLRAQAGKYFTWLVDRPEPVRWSDIRHWGAGNVATYRVIAQRSVGPLLDFARGWRPDLIVFDPTTYAGPLVAAVLGIPAVRHLWGIDYTHRTREFEPLALRELCAELGLDSVETLGTVTVDPCPASLQFDTGVDTLPIRFAPYNGPAAAADVGLPPPRRPRVCVLGSSAVEQLAGRTIPFAEHVLAGLAGLDVEVVALMDPGAAPSFAEGESVTFLGPTPLHLLLADCALVIHQGGGGALMTALFYGLPQLLTPLFTDHVANAEQLAEAGACRWLFGGTLEPDAVRTEVRQLLADTEFRGQAHRLRDEMRAQPPVGAVVGALADLAGAR
ncbi:nucleotide disphospho-sugar-binding domain-containing protein [Nocardia brasiliensis]|uniref:nucleotide disphospho-sugar-binding domain-containing protein n=1 Tax=Nocardia brasiliensis TaxID=37326 RepID=UPI00366BD6D9